MKDSILYALRIAARRNREMGRKANERVIGDKADVVTKCDMEIGDAITSIILGTQERTIVESEEHGKQGNLSKDESERYYVAIDDIDGTNNLRVGNNLLPYCSMIVVFDGSKKVNGGYKYSDYSHAACIDYVSGRIFYTENGLGKVEVYNLDGEKISDSTQNVQNNENLALTLSTDIVSTQRGGSVGYAKNGDSDAAVIFPDELSLVYKNFALVDSACSVYEYAMVGMGIRNGYVSSGKKEHELPLLYAFSRETGLDVVDFDGLSYGEKIYDFNGKNAEVVAGNEEVRKTVLNYIKKQRWVNKELEEVYKTWGQKQAEEKKKDDGDEYPNV